MHKGWCLEPSGYGHAFGTQQVLRYQRVKFHESGENMILPAEFDVGIELLY